MTYIPNSIKLAMHSGDQMPVNFGAGSVLIKVDVGEVWFVNLDMEWELWTPAGGGGTPPDMTKYARRDETNTFLANQHFQGSLDVDGNIIIKTHSGLNIIANVEASSDQRIYHLNGNGITSDGDLTDKEYVDGNVNLIVNALANHESDYTKHLGTDQNDAFDGANSPSASNVLATMNDIPDPAPPAEAPHESIPTIEMDIAGITPTKSKCQEAFNDYGFDPSKNAVFFIVDTFGAIRPNYLIHHYVGNGEFYVSLMHRAQ